MKRNFSVAIALFLITIWGWTPVFPVSSDSQAADYDAELYLYEKNPSDWSVVPGGAWGKMSYAREGLSFEFVFSGYRLRPGVSYALIYFPDPWPGEGLVCLATATVDAEGAVKMKGAAPIARLPAKYDANYPSGARIWLVLSSDIDWGKGRAIHRKQMQRWNPTEYLFEGQLVKFSVSRVSCNQPGQKMGFFPQRRIFSGGLDRQFDLYVPSNYRSVKSAPLVFNFHGFTADPESQDQLSGMSKLAEEAGFILATPKGTGNEEALSWNAGDCCGQSALMEVDDVEFTSDMIDTISAEYCVDPSRIYATGMSNGAFMSYRLACELSNRIAAIGPVAGVLVTDPCVPSRPVPVIAFHGTADLLVWYYGGMFENVPRTIAGWSMRNGCSREMERVYKKGKVTCEGYKKCKEGATVELCTIYGGGHTWPGGMDMSSLTPFTYGIEGETTLDIDASRTMWKFFKEHPRP